MNKYELRIILVAGGLMGVFIFALLFNAFSRKIDVPTCIKFDPAYEKTGVTKLNDSTYQVNVSAAMWAFNPSEISIPEGSTVDFYLTSKDVVHGFNIERKATNIMAVPGAVNKTTVKFDETGTYNIVCHEYCGAGHQNMLGKIFVTSKYQKNEN